MKTTYPDEGLESKSHPLTNKNIDSPITLTLLTCDNKKAVSD